jgi:hypothetical protein
MARGIDMLGVGILCSMGDDQDTSGGTLLRVLSAYSGGNGLDSADNVPSATCRWLGHTVLL